MSRDANFDIVAAEPPVVANIMSKHGGLYEARHSNQDTDVVAMTPNQVAEAYRATVSEHRMTFSDAVKSHKRALFWSLVMGLVRQRCQATSSVLAPNAAGAS